MTREEFVKNYLRSLNVIIRPEFPDDPHTRVTLELIRSVWDLQQQIAQLQDDLYAK